MRLRETRYSSTLLVEMQNDTTSMKGNLVMSSKIHMHLLPDPAVPLLDFYCKNILAKNMKRHMYGGTICNSKRVETAQMFSNGEPNKVG